MRLIIAKPWIIGALAGVCVVVAYGVLVARPMKRQTFALRHQIARHGSSVERAERLDRAQTETFRLEAERQVTPTTSPAIASLSGEPLIAGATCRSRTLETLSRIGERRGIMLIVTGVAVEGGAMTVPELFRLAGWEAPTLWRVDAHGSYASMTAFLTDVANGEVAAIPVGLDMRTDSDTAEWRLWRILFWM
jgi:hypothetical protein